MRGHRVDAFICTYQKIEGYEIIILTMMYKIYCTSITLVKIASQNIMYKEIGGILDHVQYQDQVIEA